MNILIPDSWLRDFLDTEATQKQIANALSLHSASVENIEKVDQDFVYNIEITTNRVDMASVYGVARETAASLNRMKIKARLKPYITSPLNKKITTKYLQLKIDIKLIPRFSTILCALPAGRRGVEENKESPSWIKDRLQKCGINPHNNIIDITNFVMLETGQPMHAFDYDKIAKRAMTLRKSKRGEKITIIDGKEIELQGGDIIIEDGDKRLIDLCGIKGGENSAIDNKTKNVLLFTQKYDPIKIRKTIQTTGIRTEAATLFEKGTNPEQTVIALQRAYDLLKKIAGAKLTGGLIDIYPNPYKPKKIKLDYSMIQQIAGVTINKTKINTILNLLGFTIKNNIVIVPSWRADDIEIQEDLIEEIVRIYGYYKIPSYIPPFNKTIDQQTTTQYYWEDRVKNLLKHLGFNEIYSYSLISQELLDQTPELKQRTIKIANPLTVETEYLRPSLLPSVLQVIEQNKDRVEETRIFELANIYLSSNKKGQLPIQKPMLVVASNSFSLLQLKAILEHLFYELKISEYEFNQKNMHAEINIRGEKTGILSAVDKISTAEIDFNLLVEHARKYNKYLPISQYPPLVEDMSFTIPSKTHIGPIIATIKKQSILIQTVKILDKYKNNVTFRIIYQSQRKSLSSEDVKNVRERIEKRVEKNFNAKLKTKE